MRVMRRAKSVLTTLAICLISLLPAAHTFGQSNGSSISDIGQQVLQGMSPDQRDQIMNQLGSGNGNGSDTQGLGGRRQNQDEQSLNDNLQQGQRRPTPEQQEEFDRLSPFLAPEDWVVITVDFNPLPAVSPGLQGLQGLGALSSGGGGGAAGLLAGLQQGQAAPGGTGTAAGLGGTQTQGAAGAANALGASPAALAAAAQAASQSSGATGATAGGYSPNVPAAPGQPRADASSAAPTELTDEQKRQRQTLIDLIRSKNPYQLGRDGTLSLPGFAPIPLAGLTEQLATLRIGSEFSLRQLYIRVTKLPLKKLGQVALKPFGYDLFNRQISTFAPATNVPVPANYVIGPGDQLEIQLYGTLNRIMHVEVGRDGRIQFPDLGPIAVGGLTFDAARAAIEARVAHQETGTHASVSMADTRSIRIFVLGEVNHPGSFAVSGLATITSGLFAAGGINKVGSLRTVQLKRQGTLVRQLDLYDMLIRGDTTDDAKLLSGDVIFVPPVGPTVSVDGEVRRPAIYEMRGETSLEGVVRLAGGLTPEADRQKGALTRIEPNQRRVVLEVQLTNGAKQIMRDGDSLRVPRLRPTLDAAVQVDGYLYSPGAFAWRDGMRLSDVIRSADDLRPNADQHYLLIRRELPPDRRVVVLSADLDAALRAPGTDADVLLLPRDRITIFDLQSSRDRIIRPLLDDLKLQSSSMSPTEIVHVDGRVNVPGDYPLQEKMTVRDLVRAGGSLSDAAYGGKAELTRYTIVNGDSRRSQLIQIDLAAAMRGDPAANIVLLPFDSLSVKQVQAWDEQDEITLIGEVKFPGKYSIKRGESLKSVVLRAGGFTDLAFLEGAVFTRTELRDREQKQLDQFAVRIQSDIAFMALQGSNANQAGAGTALAVGQSLLDQLRNTKAVGRLVINLKATMSDNGGSANDVLLRNGDQLIVPKYEQEVTVIGEVQSATSHLWRPGLARADYIALSGGETRRADESRIYVVRADGSVVADEGSHWFSRNPDSIKPGDTVVVPLNAEHIPTLPLWQAVTQIIYNVAIAAAAVHSF
jgi:polysaccharide biosynthesis/export protein